MAGHLPLRVPQLWWGKEKQISDSALKMLRKRKSVEGRKPHLYVSKIVAKATNQEVKYTLTKGFDDAEYRMGRKGSKRSWRFDSKAPQIRN